MGMPLCGWLKLKERCCCCGGGMRCEGGADPAERARVMALDAGELITDRRLMGGALTALGGVLAGFVFAEPLGLQPGTIELFGAALLMLTLHPRQAWLARVWGADHEYCRSAHRPVFGQLQLCP